MSHFEVICSCFKSMSAPCKNVFWKDEKLYFIFDIGQKLFTFRAPYHLNQIRNQSSTCVQQY
ncbi:CLUMA_CG009159, isoform A [Clunio marinus]|uniref:CLUMA_CG009159, isoform A n=1 Tax=Clunio marinus TaxID=568069 RepID=A0A1J1I5Y0_9DIPT|nr:CLUMA_CG009159, isoform A [Clunio marinus]